MNFLREEAQRILLKARNRDDELNHSACNLVRRPGQTYYYYERQSGQKYLLNYASTRLVEYRYEK